MLLSVFIVFCDADAEDANLVRKIQAAVSLNVPITSMTIDEVIKHSNWGPLSISLPGVSVVILSQKMIDDSAYRIALVKNVASPYSFFFRRYFICRGISLE